MQSITVRSFNLLKYILSKNEMKVILAFFLFIGLASAEINCNCGWRNTGRIVGGNAAGKNEYPWMVAIQNKKSNFTFCGGAIVTPFHIITAGHCVFDDKPSDLVISVGAHNVHDRYEDNSDYHEVERTIWHPNYKDETLNNDLGIIVTATEIKYNRFVGPVCMPTRKLGEEMVGKMLKAKGWGRYNYKKPNRDKIKNLNEVELEVIPTRNCTKSWPSIDSNGTQICTYTPRKDTCKGDSGGPMAWLNPATNKWTLVGIISYGPLECGSSPQPGVNTNVSAFIEWINDIIKSHRSHVDTCHKMLQSTNQNQNQTNQKT